MKTLVHFGAPEGILVDGKPHLGTDRLVPLLRNFRQHLQELGVSGLLASSQSIIQWLLSYIYFLIHTWFLMLFLFLLQFLGYY